VSRGPRARRLQSLHPLDVGRIRHHHVDHDDGGAGRFDGFGLRDAGHDLVDRADQQHERQQQQYLQLEHERDGDVPEFELDEFDLSVEQHVDRHDGRERCGLWFGLAEQQLDDEHEHQQYQHVGERAVLFLDFVEPEQQLGAVDLLVDLDDGLQRADPAEHQHEHDGVDLDAAESGDG
jgi:hypothetical protein